MTNVQIKIIDNVIDSYGLTQDDADAILGKFEKNNQRGGSAEKFLDIFSNLWWALHPKSLNYFLSSDKVSPGKEASLKAQLIKIEKTLKSKRQLDMNPLDVFFCRPKSAENKSFWSLENIMARTEKGRILGTPITSPENKLFRTVLF